MKGVRFSASFGHETKLVEILPVPGAMGSWDLHIDNRFQGQFFTRNGQWTFQYHNPPTWSNGDDIAILLELFHQARGAE